MVAIILDLLAVLIIALSVYLAYRKGLIKTLFSLVGGIVAVVLAVSLSVPVANWIDEQFVGPTVRTTVLTAVNGSALVTDYEQAMNSVDVAQKIREMPDSLRSFLESLNVDIDGIIASASRAQANTADAKEALISSIAAPVSEAISKAIALIGLVIIFFILLLVVSRLLDAVFRVLPFAKSVNQVGGILFGVIRAALLVLLFSTVVYWLAHGNVLISPQDLNSTVLLKAVNQINPILNALN